jgi:hypothetical protein
MGHKGIKKKKNNEKVELCSLLFLFLLSNECEEEWTKGNTICV